MISGAELSSRVDTFRALAPEWLADVTLGELEIIMYCVCYAASHEVVAQRESNSPDAFSFEAFVEAQRINVRICYNNDRYGEITDESDSVVQERAAKFSALLALGASNDASEYDDALFSDSFLCSILQQVHPRLTIDAPGIEAMQRLLRAAADKLVAASANAPMHSKPVEQLQFAFSNLGASGFVDYIPREIARCGGKFMAALEFQMLLDFLFATAASHWPVLVQLEVFEYYFSASVDESDFEVDRDRSPSLATKWAVARCVHSKQGAPTGD